MKNIKGAPVTSPLQIDLLYYCSVHLLRWKKVRIANPADFRVSITDMQNTPVDVKSNLHVLLAFKKV